MVADGASLLVQRARLRDGRVCDIAIDSGVVVGINDLPQPPHAPASPGRSAVSSARIRRSGGTDGAALPTIDAEGRLVTESFVDAHLHLDKVYTLPRIGDAAITAYTGSEMVDAAAGIHLARAVKAEYDRAWITPNVTRALREAVRNGVLHIQAFVDVDTAAGLEGLHGVRAAREQFADVLDVRIVAFPQDGVLRDPGAAALCAEAMQLGADVVGGIPWIEESPADMTEHVTWACALAARLGTRVAMLVDDAGDSSLRTSAMLAEAMIEHGLVGRGVACHARAVGSYPLEDQARLAALARRSGLGFVSDPHTGPLALPVRTFLEAGVRVALGQDDIEDAYYPYGRHNMLEVAFLASHLLEFKTTPDQEVLLDMVTRSAAAMLGIAGHRLSVGNPANLCIHDSERLVDVLREHAAPHWVISRGRVVAETETLTHWPNSP
ncbi:MAG: amidohydrolase family protein [Actinomycetota bacterium]|nr:amidohydrolase family protein [Actinomycetota bacterium]